VDAGVAPTAIALPPKPPDEPPRPVEPPPPSKVKRIVKGGPPAPSVACNPPFVIDSNGVKRFKVECLR
jgi:serine/threonine-protein kinase